VQSQLAAALLSICLEMTHRSCPMLLLERPPAPLASAALVPRGPQRARAQQRAVEAAAARVRARSSSQSPRLLCPARRSRAG
jgi:hypothetical protein